MRRRHLRYRVTEDSHDGVDASVRVGGARQAVRIIDISMCGVALLVETPPEAHEWLLARWQHGGGAVLVLSGPRVPDPMTILLDAVHAHPVSGGVLVGCRLLPDLESRATFEVAIQRIFNRRGAIRMPPPTDWRLPGAIRSEHGRLLGRGVLRDLSITGLSLELRRNIDRAALRGQSNLTATFHLNPEGEDLTLGIEVRYLADQTPSSPTILGAQFRVEEARLPHISRRLFRWVTERQIEAREAREQAELVARLKGA